MYTHVRKYNLYIYICIHMCIHAHVCKYVCMQIVILLYICTYIEYFSGFIFAPFSIKPLTESWHIPLDLKFF